MKNGDEPATKRDIEELAQATDSAIRTEVSVLREDIARLESRFEEGQRTILEVVQSIDKQLKEHRDLPERVARLERTVYR